MKKSSSRIRWKSLAPLGFSRYAVYENGVVKARGYSYTCAGKHPGAIYHRTQPAKTLTGSLDAQGYLHVRLIPDGGQGKRAKLMKIHRLVAWAFCGGLSRAQMLDGDAGRKGPTVDHIDGVKTHNAARNLRVISRKANTEAWIQDGRPARKEALKEIATRIPAELAAKLKAHGAGRRGKYGASDLTRQLTETYLDGRLRLPAPGKIKGQTSICLLVPAAAWKAAQIRSGLRTGLLLAALAMTLP